MFESSSTFLPLSEVLLAAQGPNLRIFESNLATIQESSWSKPESLGFFLQFSAGLLGLFHGFLFALPFSVPTLICSWRASQTWLSDTETNLPPLSSGSQVSDSGFSKILSPLKALIGVNRLFRFNSKETETFLAFFGTVLSPLFILWNLGFSSNRGIGSFVTREWIQIWYAIEPFLALIGFLLTWKILTSERFATSREVFRGGSAPQKKLNTFFIHFFLGLTNPAQHWGFGRVIFAGPDLFLIGQNSFSVCIYSLAFLLISAFFLLWFWPLCMTRLLDSFLFLSRLITNLQTSDFAFISSSGTRSSSKTFPGLAEPILNLQKIFNRFPLFQPQSQPWSGDDELRSSPNQAREGQKLRRDGSKPRRGMNFNFLFQSLILGTALAGAMQYSWRFLSQYSFELLYRSSAFDASERTSLLSEKSSGTDSLRARTGSSILRNFPSFDTNIRHRDKNLPVSRHQPIESLNSRRILSNKSPLTPEQKSEAYVKWNSNSFNRIQNAFVRQIILSRANLDDFKNLSNQALSEQSSDIGPSLTVNQINILKKLRVQLDQNIDVQSLDTTDLSFEPRFRTQNREPREVQNNTKGKPLSGSYIHFLSNIDTSSENLGRGRGNDTESSIFHDELKVLQILTQNPSSVSRQN